jgi:hypothetical protein
MTTANIVQLPGQLKRAKAAERGEIGKWDHGYVRKDKRGRTTYYIATMARIPGATKRSNA